MIKTVNYQKLFPVGAYLNERIGFEASVDEGQDPLEVLSQLKSLADKFHKESNPQLDGVTADPEKLPEQQVQADRRIGIMADDIMGCTEIKVLETYKLLTRNNAELRDVYENRMIQLQSKKQNANNY